VREYRIGEFANYLGVTPDLLKYYEEQGLLRPSRSESGYRYYPFNQSVLLMECIRLRNYGLTLREVRDILTDHALTDAQVEQRLDGKLRQARLQRRFQELLEQEHRGFLDWRESLAGRETDWEIRTCKAMCFLPHTDGYDFLKDERIYQLLKGWMNAIPLVKSAMRIDADGRFVWGLLAEKRVVELLELPVNSVVEQLPPRRMFYFKFRDKVLQSALERPDNPAHPAFRTLRALNLNGDGAYYRATLMPADWQREIAYQYGYYAIPLGGVSFDR